MKEFLDIFFASFKEFTNGLEGVNTKFIHSLLLRNEILSKNIKRSKTELEQLIFVSLYCDSFYSQFLTTLSKMGFNVKPLLARKLKILSPLRKLKEQKIIQFSIGDSPLQIIANNHLIANTIRLDKNFIETSELETILDYFQFMELAIKYVEAFELNDGELRRFIEPKLLKSLTAILV